MVVLFGKQSSAAVVVAGGRWMLLVNGKKLVQIVMAMVWLMIMVLVTAW